ncbi:hypothetical protein M2459_002702 [Parabacteroides sp. PF5-5]|uniref:hypothetical protein n=1 Tax=unclassified Parabacteroides TaxID=2649774 RepID=UPI002473EE64|nr:MULTISPECIES: hypothetical protein [unclassified Parabacteroides]MDH6305915.1 hypothetical protein [Parabacteroides sp. PH5-39]MDH6316870.1 hypothetical protein [Parabacteroides sp. PF5-13]MDH6320627.1 hypothetical protein [Parabacteroides sp. PH5-13]MDH6324452.1 hypothetical protein [Parabacteroides sp. PH5-8]MDH6328055.1 hypothetical protein [Parabacteroides sp. PH5-41]
MRQTGIIVLILWISTIPLFAQESNLEKDNRNARTFINALLVYIYKSEARPYIKQFDYQYKDGLICGVAFTSDPTHKKLEYIEIRFGDTGYIQTMQGDEIYTYTKLKGNNALINVGKHLSRKIWIEIGDKGEVVTLTNVETKDSNREIGRKLVVTYDDQNRIVHLEEYQIDLLNEAIPPLLRMDKSTEYLANDGVRIVRRNYKKENGLSQVHNVSISTLTKVDDFEYMNVTDDNVSKTRYDENARILFQNYLTDNSGWEQINEYENDLLIRETHRNIVNGVIQPYYVLNHLPEGKLKQYYNQEGTLYKEEQNFKTRTKVNDEWTPWKY